MIEGLEGRRARERISPPMTSGRCFDFFGCRGRVDVRSEKRPVELRVAGPMVVARMAVRSEEAGQGRAVLMDRGSLLRIGMERCWNGGWSTSVSKEGEIDDTERDVEGVPGVKNRRLERVWYVIDVV